MYRPQQIVVPVDFSDFSLTAARRAIGLARAFDGRVHLLHACPRPVFGMGSEYSVPPNAWEDIRRLQANQLDKLAGELSTDVPTTTEVVESSPETAIAAAVDRHSANLVVMGTHGRRGLSHAFIGSVAERTLRTVPCPTWVVKHGNTKQPGPVRKVLLATDFSVHAARASRVALGIAKAFGASVDIVHAFTAPLQLASPHGVPSAQQAVAALRVDSQEQLEGLAKTFRASDVECDVFLHDGLPSDVLRLDAERFRTDLIVMGTRGNTGLKHVFLGSVAERILRLAPCSVLTTKDGDAL